MKYSVLMPLYIKDNPNYFEIAIDSMLNQTAFPDEILIVCDGPITSELEKIIIKKQKQFPKVIKVKKFNTNRGLGLTLADGVNLCKNEIIVRMDADDYSIKDRCELQLEFMKKNPHIDVVGCNVYEFSENIDNIVSTVTLPEISDDIVKFAKRRCPIRHPALMYKKSKVIEAGNYKDYIHAQDYNLIVHMILNGSKIYNIQKYLLYMRVNSDFYKRRGGLKQAKIVLRLKKEFYKIGFYSLKDFFISGVGNAIICMLPNFVRKIFYKKMLRK